MADDNPKHVVFLENIVRKYKKRLCEDGSLFHFKFIRKTVEICKEICQNGQTAAGELQP
jgi:hypothetical protein